MAPRRGRSRPAASRPSHATIRARRIALAAVVGAAAIIVVVLALGGSGGSSGTPIATGAGTTTASSSSTATTTTTTTTTTRTSTTRTRRAAPVLVTPLAAPTSSWSVVARVFGHPAALLAQRAGVTLIRFDQHHVHLTLHAGSIDGGVAGWRYGDQITRSEIHRVVAAFNGGFKLTYRQVGFVAGGHVAAPLAPRLASIVTYTDGSTAIGAWNEGVPSRRRTVYSVLQNETLLVDRGRAAPTVGDCIITCWGATIRGLTTVARSALGIRADGELLWAAGEQLTPAALADALIAAGAVRAVELDINPDWVDGYLYAHHATGPVAVPVLPGQLGIAGQYLAPYSRDFFAIVAN